MMEAQRNSWPVPSIWMEAAHFTNCLLHINLSSNLYFLTSALETKTKQRSQKASIIDSIYLYFI